MDDGSRKEARDHKGSEEEAPPKSSAAAWLDHGSTQESACEQAGQGRDSQVRRRSVFERDKATLDVREQQALSDDNSVGRREQQGRDDAGGWQGSSNNGGEAEYTQEVLKLEDHWAT